MKECDHEWNWWADGFYGPQWEACQKCGAGRDYFTKEPIRMYLAVLMSDDGRPDLPTWMPARHYAESGP